MAQQTSPSQEQGYALAASEGETLWWESQLFIIKNSSRGLGLVEATLEAGSEPPMHIHTREDEFIYVLEGEVRVWFGEEAKETVTAGPGGLIVMPRNLAHTFGVEGVRLARILFLYLPTGFERIFWDQRTADYEPGVAGPPVARHDLARLGKAFEAAGVIITGPHPRDN
jgi:quercetin dioxygenase-like cupin family protein